MTKRVLYKQLADVFDSCKSHGKRYFIGIRDKPMELDDGGIGWVLTKIYDRYFRGQGGRSDAQLYPRGMLW